MPLPPLCHQKLTLKLNVGMSCNDPKRASGSIVAPSSLCKPSCAMTVALPVPPDSKNFAFISQFVEIPADTVFTVEYSVRAAQMAVYELLGIPRKVPAVTPHDKSLHTEFEALLKAFK